MPRFKMRALATTLIVILCTSPRQGNAQSLNTNIFGAKVEISHEPLLASELPQPGTQFTIKAKISNTRDTDRPIQVIATRDGKLLDLIPSKVYLDEYDQPTYEIQVYSPLAELSYQFILRNPDGSFSTSQRYFLRRSCIPRVDTTGLDLEGKQGEERFTTLVRTAEGLAREVIHYETINKIAEELFKDLKP